MVGLTRANLRRAVGGVGLLAAISVAILGAGSASAATIVNGDFETGNLDGWQVHNSSNLGNWCAYPGSTSPVSKKPVSPPPAGNTAAISDEYAPIRRSSTKTLPWSPATARSYR